MLRIVFFSIAFLFTASSFSQTKQKKGLAQDSRTIKIYKVTAAEVIHYVEKDTIYLEPLLQKMPVAEYHRDAQFDEDSLGIGNYVRVKVDGYRIITDYFSNTKMKVVPVNNDHRIQLRIQCEDGTFPQTASLWYKTQPILYNNSIRAFELPRKNSLDEDWLMIGYNGDTLFTRLSETSYHRNSFSRQRWLHFTRSQAGYYITAPVRFTKRIIHYPPRNWFPRRYNSRKSYNGYLLFNQPKYKPGDSLRFKGFFVNKKGVPLKQKMNVVLSFYANNRYQNITINSSLKPGSAGSYFSEFKLGDSLLSDVKYELSFYAGKREREVHSATFSIEDYLLDDIATYGVTPQNSLLTISDTLTLTANATDANGLGIMDGRVSLILLPGKIDSTVLQQVQVPDTIWQYTQQLSGSGDTVFHVPANLLPPVIMDVEAVVIFYNSANESQTKKTTYKYVYNQAYIEVKEESDSLLVNYIKEGKPQEITGLYTVGDRTVYEAQFPLKIGINPWESRYHFQVKGIDGNLTEKVFRLKEEAVVHFSRIQSSDSAGFVLFNSRRVPVSYVIMNGNKVIDRGESREPEIFWKNNIPKGKSYQLIWNYWWGEEEFTGKENLAVVDNLLSANITGMSVVYPGMQDEIIVDVTDYKGRAAPDVNITAVSYNKQFKHNISVQDPPLIRKYKFRKRILMGKYEIDELDVVSTHVLGKNKEWKQLFRLDTMKYYQALFPEKGIFVDSTPVSTNNPQVAVHVVRDGLPQPVFMLYVNRILRYTNKSEFQPVHAYFAQSGYNQFVIRLKNELLTIDSILLQRGFKYDFFIDAGSEGGRISSVKQQEYYSHQELRLLNESLLQLKRNQLENSYLIQNEQVFKLHHSYNYSYSNALIGPFTTKSELTYYKKMAFDLTVPFEAGYMYSFSEKVSRLEKKHPFLIDYRNKKKHRHFLTAAIPSWQIGDTVSPPPVFDYNMSPENTFLRLTAEKEYIEMKRNLSITYPQDSTFLYMVLYNRDSGEFFVYDALVREPVPVKANQQYELILVTRHKYFLAATIDKIKPGHVLYLRWDEKNYTANNTLIDTVRLLQQLSWTDTIRQQDSTKKNAAKISIIGNKEAVPPLGDKTITGRVLDDGKNPVAGAAVWMQGYNKAVLTDGEGYFYIQGLAPLNYRLLISFVGYESTEVTADTETADKVYYLKKGDYNLEEVIVVGYGTSLKTSVVGAMVVKSESLFTSLQGKVAGLTVTEGIPGATPGVMIRGLSSIKAGTAPVYVIDGVLHDELPANITEDMIMNTSLLSADKAIILYGNKAANGVIVITTKNGMEQLGGTRKLFKDYAFWYPELITDKKGQARFIVNYPDNITGWETYIVGMDRKKRVLKKVWDVKSFRPLAAQLSLPRFLVEGDKTEVVGKLLNYTDETMKVTANLKIADTLVFSNSAAIPANNSVTTAIEVHALSTQDSVRLNFNLQASNGMKDGENHTIPVVPLGMLESKGQFWSLTGDTTVTYTPVYNSTPILVQATNNTIGLLLEELDKLSQYPYYCTEQTASKLRGMILEKDIRKMLNQPFKGDKTIAALINRLQKAQKFDGSWGWWSNSSSNVFITNYIVQILQELPQNFLVQTNIRNGLLYLQNNLSYQPKGKRLNTLFTLCRSGHKMDYQPYLDSLVFDSLNVNDQWLFVRIKQVIDSADDYWLRTMIDKKKSSYLGAVYWEEEKENQWYWEANTVAANINAYKALEKNGNYSHLLSGITQYFLAMRKSYGWSNTYESANIVHTILPLQLRSSKEGGHSRLIVKGKEEVLVDSFPAKLTFSPQQLSMHTKGGGIIHLNAYQEKFNPAPVPYADYFDIQTHFEKNGIVTDVMKAGESVVLVVKVKVLQAANFVQLEIPIPAGVTYNEKWQHQQYDHIEYLKEKLVLFKENMPAGNYEIKVNLSPRFKGIYSVNPAKISLMYFPVFYGNSEIKKVGIAE